jgi:hypothetical protein
MERSRTLSDVTEGAANIGVGSAMTTDGTRPMTSSHAFSAGDVTRQAVLLALSALRIDLAWHAGMVGAEAAMECLHHEIGETVRRSNESIPAELSQPPEEPTRPRPQIL